MSNTVLDNGCECLLLLKVVGFFATLINYHSFKKKNKKQPTKQKKHHKTNIQPYLLH